MHVFFSGHCALLQLAAGCYLSRPGVQNCTVHFSRCSACSTGLIGVKYVHSANYLACCYLTSVSVEYLYVNYKMAPQKKLKTKMPTHLTARSVLLYHFLPWLFSRVAPFKKAFTFLLLFRYGRNQIQEYFHGTIQTFFQTTSISLEYFQLFCSSSTYVTQVVKVFIYMICSGPCWGRLISP